MAAWALTLLLFSVYHVRGLDNGLGRKPQMGWNSWNHFACNVHQTVIEQTADALVARGLDKLGYRYVNLDDCWAESRGSNGVIQPDKKKFPDIPAMVEHVHKKGLLFGLYSDAGTLTCGGRPGSLDYEEIDAKTYAEWKIDYLKYDNCHADSRKQQIRYTAMQKALNRTGRPIFVSMSDWGWSFPATWARNVSNSWRTTGDIKDNWARMISRADFNNLWADYAGPGGWNDPDMLEVGNGGMSSTEYEAHMSLWCLMKAPLLIGCNLNAMDKETLRILTNPEVIAINQDELGVQGRKLKISLDGTAEVWGGLLSGGNFVVLLLNRGNSSARITADWRMLGLDASREALVRDLWLRKDLGVIQESVSGFVPRHGVKMYKVSPQSLTTSWHFPLVPLLMVLVVLISISLCCWCKKVRTCLRTMVQVMYRAVHVSFFIAR